MPLSRCLPSPLPPKVTGLGGVLTPVPVVFFTPDGRLPGPSREQVRQWVASIELRRAGRR